MSMPPSRSFREGLMDMTGHIQGSGDQQRR
jgi:hypothetical protein